MRFRIYLSLLAGCLSLWSFGAYVHAGECVDFPPAAGGGERASMPLPGWGFSAAWLNGKLHVIGGEHTTCGHRTTHFAYDPVTDTWDDSLAEMMTSRMLFDATSTTEKLYAIAGERVCYDNTNDLVEAYDPVADIWTACAPLPEPLKAFAAASVGNRIYVFGGNRKVGDPHVPNFDTYIYDPATDSWSDGEDFPPVPGCPDAIPMWSADALGTDIYVIAGSAEPAEAEPYCLLSYDTTSDSWTYHSQLPFENTGQVFSGPHVFTVENCVAIVRDAERDGEVVLHLYHPPTDTWYDVDTSQLSFNGWGHVQVSGDGCGFYILGGKVGGVPTNATDEVQYAWFAAGDDMRFEVEEITTGTEIVSVDLGHDAAGEPFIAYDRDDPDQLRVAYRNEDTWYDQLVDEGADYEIGKLCSLVVGGDGRVHVAYRADWTIDRCCLKHAVRDEEGAWSSEVVPTASGVDQGYEPFIRLDSRDHPHIAHWCFQGSPFHGLLYTYKDDAAWHTIDIGRVLSAPSLVLDSADQPHIAACTWGSGDKTLEYMSAGGWQVLGIGGRPSIALDADDRPHIASTGTPLSYWHNDGEGWESEEICADAGAVNKRCLAIDSTGRPHVAYKIGNVVKYAYRSALGQWQTCTVFVAPADIRWQSLTMNVVDDMPRIAFSDGTTLYYCRATSMLLGDLNRDCVVDIADLAILLSNYGQWGMSEENGELTGDTLVGLDDLAMLLSVYGMTCYE